MIYLPANKALRIGLKWVYAVTFIAGTTIIQHLTNEFFWHSPSTTKAPVSAPTPVPKDQQFKEAALKLCIRRHVSGSDSVFYDEDVQRIETRNNNTADVYCMDRGSHALTGPYLIGIAQ